MLWNAIEWINRYTLVFALVLWATAWMILFMSVRMSRRAQRTYAHNQAIVAGNTVLVEKIHAFVADFDKRVAEQMGLRIHMPDGTILQMQPTRADGSPAHDTMPPAGSTVH